MRYLRATIVGIVAGVLLNVASLAVSLAWLAWSVYRDSHGSGVGAIAVGLTDVPAPILFLLGFGVAFAWSLRQRPITKLR